MFIHQSLNADWTQHSRTVSKAKHKPKTHGELMRVGRMEKRTRKRNEWSLLCVIMWLWMCVECMLLGKRVRLSQSKRENSFIFSLCFLHHRFSPLKLFSPLIPQNESSSITFTRKETPREERKRGVWVKIEIYLVLFFNHFSHFHISDQNFDRMNGAFSGEWWCFVASF